MFGGKNCGFVGKNTVILAISVSYLGKQTQVMHYAQYYYARFKIEKSGVWGWIWRQKKKQPHRKIDEAAQNCSKWDARECLLIDRVYLPISLIAA